MQETGNTTVDGRKICRMTVDGTAQMFVLNADGSYSTYDESEKDLNVDAVFPSSGVKHIQTSATIQRLARGYLLGCHKYQEVKPGTEKPSITDKIALIQWRKYPGRGWSSGRRIDLDAAGQNVLITLLETAGLVVAD